VLAIVVVSSLVVDLVGHHGDRGGRRRTAVLWALAWIVLALAFCGWIGLSFGSRAASEFATAWLVEKSLSVDNLFVFLVVFSRLGIPQTERHRVLFWGILGALVTRGAFIAAGSAMIEAWHGVIYVMGAFLVYTGVKTLRTDPAADSAAPSGIAAFVQRHLPITPRLHGHHFFTKEGGRRLATPLFVTLVVIELTDIVFAVDSIPAVFAVSEDPFIVYSSNVFAVLGLRALFVVVADMLDALPYLRYAISAILVFTGAKMLASRFIAIPSWLSLSIIAGMVATAVIAGMIRRRRPASYG